MIAICQQCKTMPRLKPAYGNFYWACECPPPQTYTTNNTAGSHSDLDANGRPNGGWWKSDPRNQITINARAAQGE